MVSGKKKIYDPTLVLAPCQTEVDGVLTVQITMTIEKLPNRRKVPNPICVKNQSASRCRIVYRLD